MFNVNDKVYIREPGNWLDGHDGYVIREDEFGGVVVEAPGLGQFVFAQSSLLPVGSIRLERFLLFSGHNYCPDGGWQDFNGSFDSVTKAVEAGIAGETDWWHVVDATTGQVVDHHRNHKVTK